MKIMDISLVNCFATDQINSGNPAAVVTNFSGSDFDRLALAKKLGSPVTVFISDCYADKPVLHFFYPGTRMPLCLHGTLASAKVILEHRNTDQLICLTEAGEQLVIKKIDEQNFQVEVSSRDIEKYIVNVENVLKMLNLNSANYIDNDLPFCVASVGSPKLLIPLNSLKCLSELQLNVELIKSWSIENNINGIYVYTNETINSSADFHARGFNPKTGHNEDAATGVAAAALSSVLKKNITIEQGNFIKKPCAITVTYINPKSIFVGGRVITIGMV